MSLPAAFLTAVERLIPAERRFDDPLSTLAFGTDASVSTWPRTALIRDSQTAVRPARPAPSSVRRAGRLLRLLRNLWVTFACCSGSREARGLLHGLMLVVGCRPKVA